MHSIKLLLILLYCSKAIASLPILQLKQDPSKIKNISQDGKITYYQKASGKLHYSTNYSFKTIFKNPKNTQYEVIRSKYEKKVAFEVDPNFFQSPNVQKNVDIYISDYGKDLKPIKVGVGKKSRFHLEDKFMTFYNFANKKITLISTESPEKSQKVVKVKNKVNPYFAPDVLVLDPQAILYTDINDQGQSALLRYSFVTKRWKTIYKSQTPGTKLELCRRNDQIILGEFPLGDVQTSSQILQFNIFNNADYKDFTQIYSSELNDIGNMICKDNKVFFIKTNSYNRVLNLKSSVVKFINVKNEIKTINFSEDITQISPLGNLIIGARLGKKFVVYGANLLLNDEIKEDKQ